MSDHVPLVEDLVYDVGMHKGEDSAFYLAKGYRVVAFEANPDLVSACKERFSAELATGRLSIVEGAITASKEPTVSFYKHPVTLWGTTGELGVRNAFAAAGEKIEIATVDFAETLRRTGMPSFMKIDIEGSDKLCLELLLGFDQRPRSVSIESDKQDWGELQTEFSLLEQLGFDRFAVVQQGGISGRSIRTRALDGTGLTFSFEEHASGPFGSDVGPWTDRRAAVARYRRIFLEYRLFGSEALIRKTRIGRRARKELAAWLGRPLPGWFDTHAARSAGWMAPTFVEPY